MARGRDRILTDSEVREIKYLRDKVGLTYREIADKLGVADHTTVFRAYQRTNKKYSIQDDPTKVEPQIPVESESEPIIPLETKKKALTRLEKEIVKKTEELNKITPAQSLTQPIQPTYLAPHDDYDTVPRNTKITDDQMADKINMLVSKLLGVTEGEVKLVIEDMTGSQRISAASSLIEKMRLLRNQSTENVSSNNLVTLISQLTTQIRGKIDEAK